MKGDERLESQHDTIPIGCSAHVEASLVIHMPDYRFGALTVQVFLGDGTRETFPLADCADVSADKSGSTICE